MRKLCSSNPRISVFHCPRSALKTLKGFTTSNLLILLLPPQHRNSPSDQNSLSQTILMLQSSKQEFPSNPSKPVHKKTTRNQTHTNQFSASIKIKKPIQNHKKPPTKELYQAATSSIHQIHRPIHLHQNNKLFMASKSNTTFRKSLETDPK